MLWPHPAKPGGMLAPATERNMGQIGGRDLGSMPNEDWVAIT